MSKGLKVLREFVESSEDPMVKRILRGGGMSTTELKELGDYLDKEIKRTAKMMKRMVKKMKTKVEVNRLFSKDVSAKVKSITQILDGTFLVEGTMEALEKLFYIKGRTVRLSCGSLWSIGKRGGRKHIGEWNGTTVEINKKSLFEIKVNYDY